MSDFIRRNRTKFVFGFQTATVKSNSKLKDFGAVFIVIFSLIFQNNLVLERTEENRNALHQGYYEEGAVMIIYIK